MNTNLSDILADSPVIAAVKMRRGLLRRFLVIAGLSLFCMVIFVI